MSKVLVVHKESLYDEYTQSGKEILSEYARGKDSDAIRMRASDPIQKETISTVENALKSQFVDYEIISREKVPTVIDLNERPLIIPIGGDGTVIDLSHYITDNSIPIMPVVADLNTSKGVLCPYDMTNFAESLSKIDREKRNEVNRVISVMDGEKLPPALNEVLINHKTGRMNVRYRLEYNGTPERKLSLGEIISSPIGSTGGIYNFGGFKMPLESKKIQHLAYGIDGEKPKFSRSIKIHSSQYEGVLCIDWNHIEYPFTIGSEVEISIGMPITIIGDIDKKREKFERMLEDKLYV